MRGGRGLLLASCSVAALLIGGGTPASANECSIFRNTGTVASLTNSDPNPPHDQCIHVTNGAGVTGDVTNTNTGTLSGITTHHTGIIIDQGASVGGSIINSGTISHADLRAGIVVHQGATLLGDISNGGTISGVGHLGGPGVPAAGIAVTSVAQFGTASTGGHIINSGTISPVVGATAGILVLNVPSVGGITNSGAISAGALYGIYVNNVVQLGTGSTGGGISNSGTILSAEPGIVALVSNFAGGFTNSGTITAGTGGDYDAIDINVRSAFTGGITNSGVISAGGGITVRADSFTGGFTNSGTITAAVNGDSVSLFANNYTGGFSNSGTISGYVGAQVGGGSFTGDISNSGTITGIRTGLAVAFLTTFAGTISNSGTISATDTGIAVIGPSAPVSIFDSGTIIAGNGQPAIDLRQGSPGNILTLGPGYSITGVVAGQGTDTFQLGGVGAGAFDLSTIGAQYTGFTTFNVVSGTWTVSNTDAQTQGWTVSGGTLAGTGSLPGLTVASGGTFAPGNPGTPGTFTVTGSLAFASGAFYLDTVSTTTASKTMVNGTATLGGASVQIAIGSTIATGHQYTILTDTGGGIGGGNIFSPTVIYGIYRGTLSYDADDVFITFGLNSLLPLLPPGVPANGVNVANAIDNFLAGGGTPPAGFQNLFNLSPTQLQNDLSQLAGQNAAGAQTSGFTLMTEFVDLMLGQSGGGGGGGGGLGFAPDQQMAALPPEIALAYDTILKAPPRASFDQRWSVWGSGFGGTATFNGNAAVGSNTVTASTYGSAAGMEYRADPNTVYGFALAGSGLNWSVAQNLGTGRSDSFQAGVYVKTDWGPAYVSGAFAVGNNWFTTNRIAVGDQLTASFTGQSYALRGEAGYRYTVPVANALIGVTPYGALQTQWFHTPTYSETDLTGGGLGLTYASATANDTRSELGARFDDFTTWNNKPLIFRGRLAWAHDWMSGTALNAVFQALPGSNFTVNGASLPPDSALTSASAQYFFTADLSFTAKFDGEFAPGAQTYAGSGTIKYTW